MVTKKLLSSQMSTGVMCKVTQHMSLSLLHYILFIVCEKVHFCKCAARGKVQREKYLF